MKTQEPTPLSSGEEKEKQLLWNTVSALLHNKGLFSREKYFDRARYETLFQWGKETSYAVQTLMHVLRKGSQKYIVNGEQVFEKIDLKLFSQERK